MDRKHVKRIQIYVAWGDWHNGRGHLQHVCDVVLFVSSVNCDLAADQAECGGSLVPAGCAFFESYREACPIMCDVCPPKPASKK